MTVRSFNVVCDLHRDELYDDLLLYVQLCVEEHLLDSELRKDEQVLLFKMIGDAYYFTEAFHQSARYYEKALEIASQICRDAIAKPCVPSELRYLIHRAYMREKKYEEALTILSDIPNAEHLPKTRSALAKLLTVRLRTRGSRNNRDLNDVTFYHNQIIAQQPYAFHSHDEVLNLGATPSRSVEDIDISPAARVYFRSRSLPFTAPLESIENLTLYPRPNTRIIHELARLYTSVGDRRRAVFELERLRSLDPLNVKGMDLLASHYAELPKAADRLDSLASHLTTVSQNSPESFLTLAYLARAQEQQSLAIDFAQRAISLAPPGVGKAPALLLKALLFLEAKRYNDADQCLQNCLAMDNRNIDAYELSVRSLLAQKSSESVRHVGEGCRKYLGAENPRALYIYAQSVFYVSTLRDQCETALRVCVEKAPYMVEAMELLAKVFDRERKYSTAISTLKKAIETNSTPNFHRLLGEFHTKLSRELGHDCRQPHPSTFNSIQTTPDTVSNENFRIPPAPRRQRNAAVRQAALDLIQSLDFSDHMDDEVNVRYMSVEEGEDEGMDILDVGMNGSSTTATIQSLDLSASDDNR